MSLPSLRALREQQGLSLRAMAEKIDYPGCDAPFLSRFERELHTSETFDKGMLRAIGRGYGRRIRMAVRERVER